MVIHGAARGADTIAADLAKGMGMKVLPFPAKWDRYGRAAGPIRNRQMLWEGHPDVVHAFHTDLEASNGTADMVKQAEKAGIPVVIHDGTG